MLNKETEHMRDLWIPEDQYEACLECFFVSDVTPALQEDEATAV